MKKIFVNLSIGAKLAVGFAVCLFLTLSVCLSGLSGVNSLSKVIDVVTEDTQPSIIALTGFENSMRWQRAFFLRELLPANRQNFATLLEQEKAKAKEATASFEEYAKYVVVPEDKANYEALKAAYGKYRGMIDEVHALQAKGDFKQAENLEEGELSRYFNEELTPILVRMTKFNLDLAKKATKDGDAATAAARPTLIGATLIAMLTGICFAILISRKIVGQIRLVQMPMTSLEQHCLKDLKEGLACLANGDLTFQVNAVTSPVAVESTDELGRMGDCFNAMLGSAKASIENYNAARASLKDLIRKVATNAAEVASTSQTLAAASEQTAATSSQIASGSEKLAVESTETARTMARLSSKAVEVGEGSHDQTRLIEVAATAMSAASSGVESVAAAAQTMEATAEQGNLAVAGTVEAMRRVRDQVVQSAANVAKLNEMGNEIGAIVGVIQGIAEQTNLLALNAAIEAARAGEHGKGFAVVADEVRKLAEQSSASTKEISALISSVTSTVDQTVTAIKHMTEEVEVGARKSEESGTALSQILSAAQKVAQQSESVSVLAQEVTTTMGQVADAAGKNLHTADEMAQEAKTVQASIEGVAAISEESAAGAEELAATVEEVGASSTELASMSAQLQSLVNQFTYNEDESPGESRRMAAAA